MNYTEDEFCDVLIANKHWAFNQLPVVVDLRRQLNEGLISDVEFSTNTLILWENEYRRHTP